MTREIVLPALSPTMEEGRVARWHVGPGSRIRLGDLIAEIETDKATMEIEAEIEGEVLELLVPEGAEDVPVNTPILRVGDPDAQATSPTVAPAEPAAPPVREAPVAAPPPAAPREQPIGVSEAAAAPPQADDRRSATSGLLGRVMAQADLWSDIELGDGELSVRELLRRWGRGAPRPSGGPPTAPSPAAPSPGAPARDAQLVPLTSMRRAIARRTTESFRDVPHFPLTVDVRMDAALALQADLTARAAASGGRVTLNDLVLRAAAVAFRTRPAANVSYTDQGLVRHSAIDIGVAIALDDGLVAPVLRDVDRKGVAAIDAEVRDLVARARAGQLRPDEMSGGSLTVSNLGMFGIRSFSSILNPPQALILSVGAAERRAIIVGDEVAVAQVASLTLTCDHRAVDGATGAEWLRTLKQLLEDPLLMLA